MQSLFASDSLRDWFHKPIVQHVINNTKQNQSETHASIEVGHLLHKKDDQYHEYSNPRECAKTWY